MSEPLPAGERQAGASILVKIRLYAMLRCHLPGVPIGASTELLLPTGFTVADLLDHLGISRQSVKSCFVNGRKQDLDYELFDGDEVAIFPPVAGGSPGIPFVTPAKAGVHRPQWDLDSRFRGNDRRGWRGKDG